MINPPTTLLLLLAGLLVGGCKHSPVQKAYDEKREIARLASVLDQDWDRVRPEITPASEGLVQIGEPAMPTLLQLMLDDRDIVRRRADYAIIHIAARMTGRYDVKNQAEDIAAAGRFNNLLQELGNLHWASPREARAASVEKWRKWLAERPKSTEPKRPAGR